jgi:H+/Cl- antiporter ClcA
VCDSVPCGGSSHTLFCRTQIPFSHISAILAHKMWRWPPFATIRGSHALRRQVLAAAVASGTAAVMGAPIGALMFSVEVTATNYLVSNLWRGFLCATTCAVTFALIHTFKVVLESLALAQPKATGNAVFVQVVVCLCACSVRHAFP